MWKFQVETKWDGKPAFEARAGKHTFYIDEPEAAGGTDLGPNQIQYMLASLGGCFMGAGRLIAKQMGLAIRGIDCRMSGEIDERAVMGQSTEVRPGFPKIVMHVKVDSDEPKAKLDEWLKQVEKRCPVNDVIVNPTPVEIDMTIGK